MSGKLEIVVKLQQALNELSEAEEQLAGVPGWMEELHSEHSSRQAEIEAVEADAEEAAQVRRQAESASRDAEDRLEHFQQQVSRVRTQREYSALLQEIDTVKSQIKALEEEALGALERYDAAQAALAEQRAAFADLDQRYTEALEKWEGEKPEVERHAKALNGQIEEFRGNLPKPLVALFQRIYDRRGGDATAALRQSEIGGPGTKMWHCSACNYLVRLQVVTDIRLRGALVHCDGCKRILFVEDEE
ncbi:MAG: hypothetical protein K8J08_14970 [Thermoanaerobaculia bacterium]|nr:hypothetical protein [Thermoanaerobaculia bacterium]